LDRTDIQARSYCLDDIVFTQLVSAVLARTNADSGPNTLDPTLGDRRHFRPPLLAGEPDQTRFKSHRAYAEWRNIAVRKQRCSKWLVRRGQTSDIAIKASVQLLNDGACFATDPERGVLANKVRSSSAPSFAIRHL